MKIVIAGDFAPGYRIEKLIERNNYQECFKQVRDITLAYDYAIVNLECPIVKEMAKPIEKCGPNLKCSPKTAEVLKYAGFNCVTIANNHIYDYGEIGIKDTLDTLDKNSIDHVGGGKNITEASRILYKTIHNKTLAIINCCEHEFSIADEQNGGANPINPIQQFYAIQDARHNADFVLVITHGGVENYQLPTPRMRELYRFYIDCGADAVINHHQHCFSGYEYYNNKPIVYGLGNFCFDEPQRNSPWNYGYMVEIEFTNSPIITLIPYTQCNEQPIVEIIQDTRNFEENISQLNDIILNSTQLKLHYVDLLKKGARFYQLSAEPYHTRITNGLYIHQLLPSFIRRKKWRLLDYIMCESHLERLVYAIRNL